MWNPFARERCVLTTRIVPESCRDRLRAETGSIWNPFAAWNHPVRGRVDGRGFWIVKSLHYRNSLQTEARGTWTPEGGGTRIEISFGMNRIGAVAMMAWLVIVVAFALAWVAVPHAPSRLPPEGPAWVLEWLPAWMVVFGLALLGFGRWLSRHESAFLLAFLRRTLECAPDETPIA
ncbi:MAG: hypothetical protein HYR73_03775 [Candidatus Eisenbacteria bacterium]|nr:hypothetical protein [Candidatus Eisenbacteria bacterium]